jgi:acylphosphatase
MIARRVFISGKVQGVYFREWAVKVAQELDVAGWVRNLRNGGVEVYAVGSEAAVARFVKRLHEGSPPSEVDQVTVEDAQIENLRSFTRRRSA